MLASNFIPDNINNLTTQYNVWRLCLFVTTTKNHTLCIFVFNNNQIFKRLKHETIVDRGNLSKWCFVLESAKM